MAQGKDRLPGPVSSAIADVVAHSLEKKKEARFLTARATRDALIASQLHSGGKLYDVYICYRHGAIADEVVARALHSALQAAPGVGPVKQQLSVYTHRVTSSHPTSSLDALRSCGVFVPILSAASIASMQTLGDGGEYKS